MHWLRPDEEGDSAAETLKIGRQAVIKTMLREALDRRYRVQQGREVR
jgi:hypothetical protein